MDPSINKIDTIQRKYSELLAEMKRTEREHIKSKKRADQLQKEKDTQRSELTKATTMKEKLEKLSRELTKENKKLKEDLRDVKEQATEKNDELHRRLEQMVDEVEEVVGDRKAPERSEIDLEQDKMYVLCLERENRENTDTSTASEKSSSRLSSSTKCVKYISIRYCGQESSKFNIISLATINSEKHKMQN